MDKTRTTFYVHQENNPSIDNALREVARCLEETYDNGATAELQAINIKLAWSRNKTPEYGPEFEFKFELEGYPK